MSQLKGKQILNNSIFITTKLNIDGDLNFSGQSITNLRAATGATEAVIYSQITGLTQSLTGGAGITVTGTTNPHVSIDLATNSGLETTPAGDAGELTAKVHSAALELTANGISLKSSISGDTTFENNLTVTGNLTVDGTTTTINTETLLVEDNIVTLNSSVTGGTPTTDAGIEVLRGSGTTSQLIWNETTDKWEAGLSGATSELITADTEKYSTGSTSTATASNASNVQSFNIEGQNGFPAFGVSLTDSFVSGGTLTGTDVVLTRNDGSTVTVDMSALDVNDTFVTGGTYNAGTDTITFTDNAAATFDVTGITDLAVTAATVSNGALAINMNDGTTVNASGDILQSITASAELTASTFSSGSQNVGLNHGTGATQLNSAKLILSETNQGTFTGETVESALEELKVSVGQKAVPTTSDKELAVTATTVGNSANTFIPIAATPAENGYISVTINGQNIIVGDGVTTKDGYFSSTGLAGGVRTFATIASGDLFVWNTVIAGYDLETTDNVAFYYDILV